MTKAVIYARFSPRPNAEDCDSVEKQRERCRSYCKAHGYDVIAEKDDEDMSGGRADNRPGLQAAIALACKHKAVLVVYKLDRLARNTRDALDVLERLQKSKADLASLVEQINSRSPMGKFFFTQLAAFAELEREQIRARTSTAMRAHQSGGRRMTRTDRCPFGLQPDPADSSRLIDHADELAASTLTNCVNVLRFPWTSCRPAR
jgi:site-specific DNA recombinase